MTTQSHNRHRAGRITRVELYARDAVIVREGEESPAGGGKRTEITELSADSLRRLAFVANNSPVEFDELLTLTYPREFPADGKIVKQHLRAFLQACRRRAAGAFSYLWFLEFQKRGAPHVHLLYAGADLANDDGRQWVSERWYEIVDSGDERHLRAGTRTERVRKRDGARRYVVKYASKPQQKIVPADYRNVGRFWGHSRDVTPAPMATISRPAGATSDDVRELLAGWKFAGRVTKYLPRTLYNAAPIIAGNVATTIET